MADVHKIGLKKILSTDVWLPFQSIEMMLKKPGEHGRCLFAVKVTLKKNLAKRRAWQMFSFIFNPLK